MQYRKVFFIKDKRIDFYLSTIRSGTFGWSWHLPNRKMPVWYARLSAGKVGISFTIRKRFRRQ